MTPRNAIIGAVLLALAIVGGISFYTQWELKRFTASLPMPPVAVPEQENTGTQRQLPKTGDEARCSGFTRYEQDVQDVQDFQDEVYPLILFIV